MRYHHLLLLPPVLGISIDDIQAPFFSSPKDWARDTPLAEGTCNSAVDVMAFHREKMNEYLCRQFLADEITVAQDRDGMQNRSQPSLIEDAGSAGYKDWLARSTTLEDIYRHYEQSTAEDAPVGASLPAGHFDGEVTGYAMLGNKVSAPSSGYGGSSYGPPSPPPHSSYSYQGDVSKGSEKGMKLNDLFHLALTAIAFLAFGTFIIEVIMCIIGLETKNTTTQIMMLGLSEPLQSMNYFKTEAPERSARTFEEEMQEQASRFYSTAAPTNILEEELALQAAHATASLDGMEQVHRDNGRTLQRALCHANQYSRSLTGMRRIWLPLWSFGMSWIGGRHLAMTTDSSLGTLKFLTATIQGMAGANCSAIVM